MRSDFSTVTELPGTLASKEQVLRIINRYGFAAQFCSGKNVLEVGCGPGLGLGYLKKVSKSVTGGDIDKNVLYFATKKYARRTSIETLALNAEELPFINSFFDVVILFECIYYLLISCFPQYLYHFLISLILGRIYLGFFPAPITFILKYLIFPSDRSKRLRI